MEITIPNPANNTPDPLPDNQTGFPPPPAGNPNGVQAVQEVEIPVDEASFRKEVIAKLDTILAVLIPQ